MIWDNKGRLTKQRIATIEKNLNLYGVTYEQIRERQKIDCRKLSLIAPDQHEVFKVGLQRAKNAHFKRAERKAKRDSGLALFSCWLTPAEFAKATGYVEKMVKKRV